MSELSFRNFMVSLQFSSVTQSYPTLCNPMNHAHQASLFITNSRSPPKPMSIESVMPPNHLILCRPLLLPPSNLSQHQGLFKQVSSPHQVAKVLEFQLQHQSYQSTTNLLSKFYRLQSGMGPTGLKINGCFWGGCFLVHECWQNSIVAVVGLRTVVTWGLLRF